jgi:threonine/homoserine/homoserine lactone efflux protein
MESLLAMLGYVVVSTMTPGPNNFMVLASGANWGLTRSLPHICGIAVGFPVMIMAVGFGLELVFERYPLIELALRYVAFAYLLWIAWKIVRSSGGAHGEGRVAQPLTVLQAAAFQWVNPKAWALVLGGVAIFAGSFDSRLVSVILLAILFGLVCLPNGVIWALFGGAIGRFLSNERKRRIFNVVMAVLLVASVAPMLF